MQVVHMNKEANMDAKQERAFCRAMTKTLHAYEDLIEDTERNLPKWDNYGGISSCRICKVLGGIPTDGPTCSQCPLDCCYDTGTHFDGFRNAMLCDKCELSAIRKAARARYRWLIRKIKSAGYEYI